MSRTRKKKTKRHLPTEAKQVRLQTRASTHSVPLLAALAISVAIIVTAVHWPALSAKALSFDDDQYLTKNALVQKPSWASAGRFLSEVGEPSTVRGYYQPLAMISLMLDYAAGGRPDNLQPFHRTSLILHVVNTMLIVVLLFKLFGEPWGAAMVALLFGVHPMTVETMPWVGERKTLLATFFAMWSLILYVQYARTNGWTPYVLCLVMYVLALMSKPTSTPLPVVFLLMDYWPIRRLNQRCLVEKVPFFIVAGIFAYITIISQGRTASIGVPREHPASFTVLTLCHNIVFYLRNMVWPVNLTSHYPFPKPFDLSNLMVLTGVIGTCVLMPTLLISLRWTRAILTGWLIFFVAIFPAMGVIGFTNAIASDKFAYLPSVGILMLLAWLLNRAWKASNSKRQWIGPRATVMAMVLAAVALEAIGTRHYLVHWRNSETLMKHMLCLAPNVAPLHYSLGAVLAEENRVDEAIECYREALRIKPDYARAHYNLANALSGQGKTDEAITHYNKAVSIKPDYAEAHTNFGNALLAQDKFEEAIVHYARTLDLQPDNYKAYNNLGNALLKQGKLEQAIEHYHRAVQLKPDLASAMANLAQALARMNNLGASLGQRGRIEEAITCYEKILRIAPNDAQAHIGLGASLAQQGKIDRAIEHFHAALRIDPNSYEAHRNLATTLAKRGDTDLAIEVYHKALELQPEDVHGRFLLGKLLEQHGQIDEAIEQYRQALQINPRHQQARERLNNALKEKPQ